MKSKDDVLKSIFSISSVIVPSYLLFRFSGKLILPAYTTVSDHHLPHISNLFKPKTKRQFSKDLDLLLKYFKPIALQDLLNHVYNKKPIGENCFHISFDDGLSGCHDTIAPILRSKGIPATFFINPAFVDNKDMMHRYKVSVIIDAIKNDERKKQNIVTFVKRKLGIRREAANFLSTLRYSHRRVMNELAQLADIDFTSFLAANKPYMDKQQIQKLIDEGFTVGAHSMDHPEYYMLTEEEQLKQTSDSISYVEKEFKTSYRIFSFPFSDRLITGSFFQQILHPTNPLAQLTFGSSGMIRDILPYHLQRIPMEKPFGGREVIKGEFLHSYLRRLTGNNILRRD